MIALMTIIARTVKTMLPFWNIPNAAPMLYQCTMRAYGLSHAKGSGNQVSPRARFARTRPLVHWSRATIRPAIANKNKYFPATLFKAHLNKKIVTFYHYAFRNDLGTRALMFVSTSYSLVSAHSARS